jgi:hypothetical protein
MMAYRSRDKEAGEERQTKRRHENGTKKSPQDED